MTGNTKKRIVYGVLIVTLGASLAWSLRPTSMVVSTAAIVRGPLRVTVQGEGRTRVRERYVVSAPLAGRLARITLDPGDRVAALGAIATIAPSEPPLLDARSRAEAKAQVKTHAAAIERTQASVAAAEVLAEQSRSELVRQRLLAERGAGIRAQLEAAELDSAMRRRTLEEARAAVLVVRRQLEGAQAVLSRTTPSGEPIVVHAPIAGTVLRVFKESADIVAPGTPLVELGDLAALEVVVDLVSTDAVQLKPGAQAYIDQWGGSRMLMGRISRIEPAAFTKISALGVEEQRVNVIVELDPLASASKVAGNDAPSATPLGDGYRVEVQAVVWETADVLKVPVSALFREEKEKQRWAVYVVDGGRARRRELTIGHRNAQEAEVQAGLRVGEAVIVYPGDKLSDGARVVAAER